MPEGDLQIRVQYNDAAAFAQGLHSPKLDQYSLCPGLVDHKQGQLRRGAGTCGSAVVGGHRAPSHDTFCFSTAGIMKADHVWRLCELHVTASTGVTGRALWDKLISLN